MAALLSQRRDNNDKPRKIYDILRRTIKRAKQLSGRQLSDLFDKYRVWNYQAKYNTPTIYFGKGIGSTSHASFTEYLDTYIIPVNPFIVNQLIFPALLQYANLCLPQSFQ